ncbi:MAG: hypothetical protein ACR2PG_00630 [Hyphomicrobiaceae bacterium]
MFRRVDSITVLTFTVEVDIGYQPITQRSIRLRYVNTASVNYDAFGKLALLVRRSLRNGGSG